MYNYHSQIAKIQIIDVDYYIYGNSLSILNNELSSNFPYKFMERILREYEYLRSVFVS
jgi:hypothetical protein